MTPYNWEVGPTDRESTFLFFVSVCTPYRLTPGSTPDFTTSVFSPLQFLTVVVFDLLPAPCLGGDLGSLSRLEATEQQESEDLRSWRSVP